MAFCTCGREKRRVVKKDCLNKGRGFFVCDECGTFRWDVKREAEPAAVSAPAPVPPAGPAIVAGDTDVVARELLEQRSDDLLRQLLEVRSELAILRLSHLLGERQALASKRARTDHE